MKQALEIALPLLEIDADFYGALNVGMLITACAIWKNDALLQRTVREYMSAIICNDDKETEIKP